MADTSYNDISALHSLPGAFDNLDEPEPYSNRPGVIIGILVLLLVLKWLSVSLRLYTRAGVTYSLGWDDVFVALVLVNSTIGSIFVILMTKYGGLGRHFLTLTEFEVEHYLKYFYVANATYIMSIAFIKMSLLFQFRRVYPDNPRIRAACMAVIVFTAAWAAVYSFMAWFPCFPIQRFWQWSQRIYCYGFASVNTHTFYATYVSHATVNMVLDIVVLLIPVPLYFEAKTERKTKLGLLSLHAVGVVLTGLSIWRLASLVNHRVATAPTVDPTWYGPISIMLVLVEVDIGSVCASIPVFWPILSARLSKIFITHEINIEYEDGSRKSMGDDEAGAVEAGKGFPQVIALEDPPLEKGKPPVRGLEGQPAHKGMPQGMITAVTDRLGEMMWEVEIKAEKVEKEKKWHPNWL